MSGFILDGVIKELITEINTAECSRQTIELGSEREQYLLISRRICQNLKEAYETKPSTVEAIKCPECGGPMLSRKGQFGVFWGCKQYPRCKGTRDSMGKSKAEREAEKDKKRGEREWTVE